MTFLDKLFLFCPICKKKVLPIENKHLKEEIRKRAQEFSKKYNLEQLIEKKDYQTLQQITIFKKLEDSCIHCPECNWSPFQNHLSNTILKKFAEENGFKKSP